MSPDGAGAARRREGAADGVGGELGPAPGGRAVQASERSEGERSAGESSARGAPPEIQDGARRSSGRHRSIAKRATAPRARRAPPERRLRPVLFALGLVPLALVLWNLVAGNYSEPIEEMEKATGTWALRLVAVTLAITPARRLLGWNWLGKYRRMVGLFAFFYATVHLSIYAVLDMELDVADLVEDVVEHPYVTVGFASWLLLVPLAVTSTKGWVRRLGGRRWNRLHQLTYAVAVGGTVHYLWAVKKDTLWPLTYAVVFAVLLGGRVWRRYAAARATRRGRQVSVGHGPEV